MAYPRAIGHFAEAAVEDRAPQPRSHPVAPHPTTVRMWLPLTPLFLLLAPFALVLAPLGFFVPPRWRPNPFLAVFALGAVLLSLGGTDITVEAPRARVRLKIL
jgi:hypothetical protein